MYNLGGNGIMGFVLINLLKTSDKEIHLKLSMRGKGTLYTEEQK